MDMIKSSDFCHVPVLSNHGLSLFPLIKSTTLVKKRKKKKKWEHVTAEHPMHETYARKKWRSSPTIVIFNIIIINFYNYLIKSFINEKLYLEN